MKIRRRCRGPTTLVSPVTIGTPARAAAAARIDATTRRRSASGKSLLEDEARATGTAGRAPPIARSFTVPLTASSPMSPPGKKSGVTT